METDQPLSLQDSVARQRHALKSLLSRPLAQVAAACCPVWGDRATLNTVLGAAVRALPYCKFMYALRPDGVQVSDNITQTGCETDDYGRDRSDRPYMREAVPASGFLLSNAYISLRAKRPSLTAIQLVRDDTGHVLGFVGADFDLRDLSLTRTLYEEPRDWRQIRGDPAIRGGVFHQARTESVMDQQIDTVLGIVEELILDHGVFHCKLHFSSSRATIWLMSDPYRYRLLDIDALTRPDTCLSYPRHPYPADASIPSQRIREILYTVRGLRFMDETFYLRSATLNIFNGMIALTFSCDGTHYLAWDEFLDKGQEFWISGT